MAIPHFVMIWLISGLLYTQLSNVAAVSGRQKVVPPGKGIHFPPDKPDGKHFKSKADGAQPPAELCRHGDMILNELQCMLMRNRDHGDPDRDHGNRHHGNRNKRAAYTALEAKLWPQGIVPYVFNANLGTLLAAKVTMAMEHITNSSCIQFLERTDYLMASLGHNQYVEIAYTGYCNSGIGMAGINGVQFINLDGDGGCGDNFRTPVHELCHTLGLFHEHERIDRFHYVDVMLDNVLPEFRNGYGLMGYGGVDISVPYDISSIMHYDAQTFQSAPDVKTMSPKNEFMTFTHAQMDNFGGKARGLMDALSHRDKMTINKIYTCAAPCAQKACQNGGFQRRDCTCECPYGTAGDTCQTVDTTDVTPAGCGGVLRGGSGTIKSPNHPGGYPYGANCKWLIKADNPGKTIRVRIDVLDFEDNCIYELLHVGIYGPGVDHYGVMCADKAAFMNKWVVSQGDVVYIEFYSSPVVGGLPESPNTGFKLSYETGNFDSMDSASGLSCFECTQGSNMTCLGSSVYDSQVTTCALGDICRVWSRKTGGVHEIERGCSPKAVCTPGCTGDADWECTACCDFDLCNYPSEQAGLQAIMMKHNKDGHHSKGGGSRVAGRAGQLIMLVVVIMASLIYG